MSSKCTVPVPPLSHSWSIDQRACPARLTEGVLAPTSSRLVYAKAGIARTFVKRPPADELGPDLPPAEPG